MPAAEWSFADQVSEGRSGASLPPPRLGEEIAGRYRLLSEIARGKSSLVYEALDLQSQEKVALKTLFGSIATDAADRVEREAQLLAKLRHPGVVQVVASGVSAGRPYMACELVPGRRSLLEALDDTPSSELLALLLQAADALGYAHAKGVIHRDVKPANLLIAANGRLKVVDFGLGWSGDLETLTQSGVMVGTPSYMAPEQFVGDRSHKGPSCDVWALGVLLYRLLTGVPPFRGRTFIELRTEVLERDPPPLGPVTSPQVAALCLKALDKNPVNRQPDAGSFAQELRAALEREGEGSAAASTRTRRPWGVLLVGLLVLTGMGWWLARDVPPPPETQPETTIAQVRALLAAGDAELEAGDVDKALEAWSRLLALDPEHSPALRRRALIYAERGDTKRALADLDAALLLDPGSAQAWQSRGVLQLRRGESRAALADFSKALELEVRAGVFLDRAGARTNLGDLAGALRDVNRSLDLEPQASAWCTRGVLHRRLGDPRAAQGDFANAIEADPSYADSWLQRGLLRASQGETLQAASDLERFLSLAPKHPLAGDARSVLGELRTD